MSASVSPRLLIGIAAVAIASSAATWISTRSRLYWISEHELSRTALLALESDTVILQGTVQALQAAIDSYTERTGSTPESLDQVLDGSVDLCQRPPSGFRTWSENCSVYDTDLGSFGFSVRGNPPRLHASGCRWIGQKFGCVTFPDPGPPRQCSWCKERSIAVDGWRITLQPPPRT